jgi:hypothetical protein
MSQRRVVIACGTFETKLLDKVKYMDFLKWAHDACHVNSEDFTSCFNFRLAIEYERLTRTGRSARPFFQKALDRAVHGFLSSILGKARQTPASEPQQTLL